MSCYKEVEEMFSNPNIATLGDLNEVLRIGIYPVFPDITSIDQEEDITGRGLILILNFINGSKQRIELWE